MLWQGIDPFSFSAESVGAWATVALVTVAIVGFYFTIAGLRAGRRRERVEVDPYIRVDLSPPGGTPDYTAPMEFPYTDITAHVDGVPSAAWDAGEQGKVIAAWFRNQQTHPLGFALGVAAQVSTEVRNLEGDVTEFLHKPAISYIEPGRGVRIDLVRFPPECSARSMIRSIEYRSLYYDASTTKHGRWECRYEDGEFRSIPWSDPPYLFWRDFPLDLRDRGWGLVLQTGRLARDAWKWLRSEPSQD